LTLTARILFATLIGGARERRLCELLKDYHATKKNLIIIFVLYKREVRTLFVAVICSPG
jgi:hypothetical protein